MFNKLLTWSELNGAKINYSLDLFGKTDRTVISKDFIPEGSVIIKYPKNLTIGYRDTKQSYGVVLDTIVSLLYEIRRGWISPFYQYINLLPQNLTSLPSVKLTPQEFRNLEYLEPYIFALLKQHYNDQMDIHKDINKLDIDQKYKEYSYTSYLFNLYKTRAWADFGFVPLLDLINHSSVNNNISIDEVTDKNYFIVKAIKDIRPSTELLHKYNNFSKKHLFYIYGISD